MFSSICSPSSKNSLSSSSCAHSLFAYTNGMKSDFEKFSAIVLDAFNEFRSDFSEFRSELTEFRQEMHEFKIDNAQRLSNIERELVDINVHLDKLEADMADVRGYAKELDGLRDRIRAIEKHLGLTQHIAA